MALEDIRVLFYPKTNEYVVVSGDNHLRLSEEEFHAVRTNMNGIGIALAERARKRKMAIEAKNDQKREIKEVEMLQTPRLSTFS